MNLFKLFHILGNYLAWLIALVILVPFAVLVNVLFWLFKKSVDHTFEIWGKTFKSQ